MRMGSDRQAQRIPHVPVRLDQLGRQAALTQLGAQQLDVGIDRAVQRVGRIGPDQIHQLGAREDAAWAPQQRRQQQELVAREREVAAAASDALRRLVQAERGSPGGGRRSALLRRLAVRRAPQDRLDPRADLAWRKRLAHVVVRAQLQPEHTIDLLAARGEEDDGQLARSSDGATDIEAVAVGHADVEDREVGRVLRKRGQRFARQGDVNNLEALAAQCVEQRVGDGGFVFEEEDAGQFHLSPKGLFLRLNSKRLQTYFSKLQLHRAFNRIKQLDLLQVKINSLAIQQND